MALCDRRSSRRPVVLLTARDPDSSPPMMVSPLDGVGKR